MAADAQCRQNGKQYRAESIYKGSPTVRRSARLTFPLQTDPLHPLLPPQPSRSRSSHEIFKKYRHPDCCLYRLFSGSSRDGIFHLSDSTRSARHCAPCSPPCCLEFMKPVRCGDTPMKPFAGCHVLLPLSLRSVGRRRALLGKGCMQWRRPPCRAIICS